MRTKIVAGLALAVASLGVAGWVAAGSPASEPHAVEIVRFGPEGRAWLGLVLGDVSADQARGLKLEPGQGASAVRVEPGSPAQKAGLQAGDVVLRFDGERVRSAAQLARLVRETPAGRRVALDVWREGSARTLTAELAERGASARAAAGDFSELRLPHPDELPELREPGDLPHPSWRGLGRGWRGLTALGAGPRRLGISFQEIDGQLARYFQVEGGRGLLVTEADEGSPAAQAGLRAGDVLLSFDGRPLRDGGDLRHAVDQAEAGQALLVDVLRAGQKLQLTVTLSAERQGSRAARPN